MTGAVDDLRLEHRGVRVHPQQHLVILEMSLQAWYVVDARETGRPGTDRRLHMPDPEVLHSREQVTPQIDMQQREVRLGNIVDPHFDPDIARPRCGCSVTDAHRPKHAHCIQHAQDMRKAHSMRVRVDNQRRRLDRQINGAAFHLQPQRHGFSQARSAQSGRQRAPRPCENVRGLTCSPQYLAAATQHLSRQDPLMTGRRVGELHRGAAVDIGYPAPTQLPGRADSAGPGIDGQREDRHPDA